MGDLKAWILTNYGPLAAGARLTKSALVAAVFNLYQADLPTMSPWEIASQIYTESEYLCPTERSAVWLTSPQNKQNVDKVYTYRLMYAPSNMKVNADIVYAVSSLSLAPFAKRISCTRCPPFPSPLLQTPIGRASL